VELLVDLFVSFRVQQFQRIERIGPSLLGIEDAPNCYQKIDAARPPPRVLGI